MTTTCNYIRKNCNYGKCPNPTVRASEGNAKSNDTNDATFLKNTISSLRLLHFHEFLVLYDILISSLRLLYVFIFLDTIWCLDIIFDIVAFFKLQLWTRIFHVRPHSIGETHFLFVRNWFLKKSWSRQLFYFYFWRENKTRNKTLKKWLPYSWKKHVCEKPESKSGDQITYWEGTFKRQHPSKPSKGLY